MTKNNMNMERLGNGVLEYPEPNDVPSSTIYLGNHEYVDEIRVWYCVRTRCVRGITFITNSEKCWLLDGEVEVNQFVELSPSVLSESDFEAEPNR